MKETSTYIIKSIYDFFIVKVSQTLTGYDVRVLPVVLTKGDSPQESHHEISEFSCLYIILERESNSFTGHIDFLKHHKECSVSSSMEKGFGTQAMVKSVLALCRRLFGISMFSFYDASEFLCDTGGGNILDVNMTDHNLLVYGKTWYERKFQAFPADEKDANLYNHSKTLLNRQVDVEKADQIIASINRHTSEKNRKLYSQIVHDSKQLTITWNEVFTKIHKLQGGCEFFTGKNMDVITDMFSIYEIDEWTMPITDEDVETYLIGYKKICHVPEIPSS